jgi:hypothetical protein
MQNEHVSDLEESYNLKSEYEECRNRCHFLEMAISKLKKENCELKEQIQYLALENSNTIYDKKTSKYLQMEEKWKYYHRHKSAIKDELEKENKNVLWYMVKKESDIRYLRETFNQ